MIKFLFFLFFFHAIKVFACTNEVNSKEVIMFLDVNRNPSEVSEAKKAACQLGQDFLVIPEQGSTISKRTLDQALRRLSHDGVKVKSLLLSGHDSGGNFSGLNGSIERSDIVSSFKAYPEIHSNLEGIFALGCHTGTDIEIETWKNLFPSLDYFFGYESPSPLGSVRYGRDVFYDALINKDELTQASSESEILDIIGTSFRQLGLLERDISIYIDTSQHQCTVASNGLDYLYKSSSRDNDTVENFQPADVKKSSPECISARAELPSQMPVYIKYFIDLHPLPKNTSNTDIHRFYLFLQENTHCFYSDDLFDGHETPTRERVLMMRFFHKMKHNFLNYYSDDIDLAFSDIDEILSGPIEEIKAPFIEAQALHRAEVEVGDQLIDEIRSGIYDKNRITNYLYGDYEGEILREKTFLTGLISEHSLQINLTELDNAVNGDDPFAVLDIFMKVVTELENSDDFSLELLLEIADRSEQFASLIDRRTEATEFKSSISEQNKSEILRSIDRQATRNDREYSAIEEHLSALPDKIKVYKKKIKKLTHANISNMSREEIAELTHNIKSFEVDFNIKDLSNVKRLNRRLHTMLVELDCVPFNWHDYPIGDSEVLDAPSC